MQKLKAKRYEDYGYVLDVFPASQRRPSHVRVAIDRNEIIVHLLGEEYFTLLEAAVSERFKPQIGVRVYIGRDVPREILRIIRRLDVSELSDNGRNNLEPIIQKMVADNEGRFVEFFNRSNPITPRLHALELIPGIGKKMLQKFLSERERAYFTSFEDIKKRTGLLNPAESISKRIQEELMNREEKYRIFVREPSLT
ncbi:MAG: DUF655 domain-containing protein [Nitrososphaerota archaeon]